jgi:hypothetical protein
MASLMGFVTHAAVESFQVRRGIYPLFRPHHLSPLQQPFFLNAIFFIAAPITACVQH